MNFDKKCIMCESSDNLNTIMSVKVDDKKYDVSICDVHADDITPKKIKELVSSKLEEFKSLMEKMKEFGIEINMSSGGIAVASGVEEIEEEEVEVDHTKKEIQKIEKEYDVTEVVKPKTTKTSKNKIIVAKKKQSKEKSAKVNMNIGTPRSLGGSVKGIANTVNLEQPQAINANEAITKEISEAKLNGVEVAVPVTEDIEYQVVSGRAGAPMTIPKKITHNDGSTQIAVVDTGGDKTIQDRFIAMAQKSKSENAHVFGRDGYDTYSCTMCSGSGIAKIGGEACKKCNGIGLLNR